MKTTRWCKRMSVAAFGLLVVGLTGCQTWVGGMTLPSGHYLEHRPQYFRPDPEFPLQNELAQMQGYDRLAIGGPATAIPQPPAPPLEAAAPGPR